jgi:hypothetical protein
MQGTTERVDCSYLLVYFYFVYFVYLYKKHYICIYILCRYITKYIIFEFHFSSFNSAPGIATGITAKEYTGTATFLLSFTLPKHSLYRSLQLLNFL